MFFQQDVNYIKECEPQLIPLHGYYMLIMFFNLFTVNISKAKVEMFHQVGMSHDHVKDVSSSGFHFTLDQDVLTVWHHHNQLSLKDWRFTFL